MNKFLPLLILALSFSFLSFKDNPSPRYKPYKNNLIVRNDGAIYQKGMVNLKFKSQIYSFDDLKFGIDRIDNLIAQFNVTKVYQRYPLKKNVSLRVVGDDDLTKIFTFRYSGDIDPTELSEMIYEQNKDIIEWIEPDFVFEPDYIPNDPNIAQQWHISKINSYQAWDLNRGDTSIVIGIVDTGSDLDHPDLLANIKLNYADPPGNNIDDDNNGYVDDYLGWDFYYSDNDPNIQGTGNPHGSHVSGDASQVTDNNTHGAGIGFKVKLRISKHTDDVDPEGLLYSTPDGIVYLYQNGAKVINCSFGSGTFSSFVQNIINNAWNAGTVICASAGNGNPGQEVPRYPASYDNVVSVAATNANDIKAGFSNYHSTVDICAPGESILSTVYNNTYAIYSGTSMSTPITCGTIGLIRSKYPSWTPTQVVARLLAGVDSIYHLNPTFVGKLGTGRVNAFKCVSDNPIISVVSSAHNDSVYGNNDKVYDIGEKISLMVTYKNVWVSGNNISLRLTTTDPDVEIMKDSVFVGNLSAYTTYSTTIANTFEVRAKATCPFDKVVTFRLGTSTNAYPNQQANTISVTFRNGWANHNINNLIMSLTKDGAVGKKTQAYGNGLFLTGNPSTNQMLEGGLMIGVSNTKVSDVCRRVQNASDTDFVGLAVYTINTPGTASHQDGFGLFNDNGAGSNKIGVTVRPTSYAWNSSPDANYIILRYVIKNTSGSSISNMYAGIYAFYTPNGQLSNNFATLDTVNKLGYSYNSSNSDPHLGVALLTNQNLNFKALLGAEVLTGFTTQEKWDALSNGISVPSQGPNITCFVISAGPFNLSNNDSVTVGFAVVKGTNLAELKTNTIAAKNKYGVIGVEQISGRVPLKYALYQNYPNPFNPVTTIRFDIPKSDYVNIKIYDITGRFVGSLVDRKLDAGSYKVGFDGSNLASGVYFYRVETSKFVDIKKMVILK